MHVYRNRRYEEEIVVLMWHEKEEQRMIEASKQKTQIQAHHKITESATQTHTHRNKQKTTCTGYDSVIQGEIFLRGRVGQTLSAPVPDDECGDTIIHANRHEARSSGLGDGSSYRRYQLGRDESTPSGCDT
jgi:hypothetical protein